MSKKVKTEDDLSYSDSEKFCNIIDKQLRSHHNVEFFKTIAIEANKNKFYESFTKSSFSIISHLFVAAISVFITLFAQQYFYSDVHRVELIKENLEEKNKSSNHIEMSKG